MTLALDGSVHGSATAASKAVSLTTVSAGDIILVFCTVNGGPVTAVSSANLTFARRAQNNVAGGASYFELWWAYASSALSAESITVFQTSSAFVTVDAIGVSSTLGFTAANPFDSNASLPSLETVINVDVVLSTTTASSFIVSGYRFNATPSPTAGTGFTIVSGANFALLQYKIVAAAQTNLHCLVGTGAGNENGGVGDALIETGGGGTSVALTGISATGSVGSFGKSVVHALTGTAGTGSLGTVTPNTNKNVALTGISGTGSVGSLGKSVSHALTGISATGFLGTLTPSTAGPVTLALTGISATGSLGTLTPSGQTQDTHDPGLRKRLRKAEERRRKEFEAEADERARRRTQVIHAFERVIEGKPEIPAEVAEEIVGQIEERAPAEDEAVDFQSFLDSVTNVQRLWDEYLERDDEEVLTLL